MTDSKAFGRMLTNLCTRKGTTLEQLASMIKTSKNRLAEWESGVKTPNREFAKRIVSSLNLSDSEANELLSLAGHSTTTLGEQADGVDLGKGNVFRPTGIVVTESVVGKSSAIRDQQIETLKTQLNQTQNSVEVISSKLDKIPSNQFSQQSEIISAFHELQGILKQVQIPSQPITAPVILPPPEDMEVRLVSSTSLERLEEYRSEANKWNAVVGILLGAILGIIINAVTGGHLTTEAWILILAFAILALLTGLTAWNYQKRGNKVKAQILREPPTVVSGDDDMSDDR